MDIADFKEFSQKCSEELPNEIGKILQNAKREKSCSIGFITTDDFYGFYLSWGILRYDCAINKTLITCAGHINQI